MFFKRGCILVVATLLLSGCYITKYQLGGNPSGEIQEADYPPPDKKGETRVKIMVDGKQVNLPPVDMKDYCNGKVAEITTKESWSGSKILFACASAEK
jgi:hypothetical protein